MNPSTLTSDVLLRLKPTDREKALAPKEGLVALWVGRHTEREKALALKEGSPVMFVGVLDDWGTLMPVTLDHGTIVTK